MNELVYESSEPISKDQAKAAFESSETEVIITSLVAASFHLDDWRWVQDKCLTFLASSDNQLRKAAIVCLGTIARMHGELDLKKVIPILKGLEKDPLIGGEISFTLDEIACSVGEI